MSIVAKWLVGSRWHLTWMWPSISPGNIVFDGEPALPPQKVDRPPFFAYIYCGQTAGWIRMALNTQVGLDAGNIVLDGDAASLLRKGQSPHQFSAHVYYIQTAGWIKMRLDTEVGLGLGDIVLDGDPATLPNKKGTAPSQFSAHVYCSQTAGWIKTLLGTEVNLSPGHIVLDKDQLPR